MQLRIFSIICLLFGTTSAFSQERKFSFSKQKMGSPFNIIIVSNDSAKARGLSEKSYSLVDSFNMIFSDYDPNSELSRLNQQAGKGKQTISPAMKELLLLSAKAYKKSIGSFDITVGPLSILWRGARKRKEFPVSSAIGIATRSVSFDRLIIDSIHNYLTIPDTSMRIDVGGIAKGYIAQKVIDFLYQNGINQALADAGGDMVMSKSISSSKGWAVGVNIPETTDRLLPRFLLLQNKAVATSGDAYQYIEHHGKKYSHIIDPRTGYGVQSQRNVTVIANNGSDADWLATACSILSIEKAKKVATAAGAELLITVMKDGKVVYYNTPGFAHYWKP